MNKKLLLAGACLAAGYFAITGFAGKTMEQQRQEIQQAVEARVQGLRDSLTMVCDMRIAEESDRRFNETMALRAQEEANAPKGTRRPGRASGPRVDPLPQGGKSPADQKRDKMQGTPNTEEKREKMQGNPPSNTDSKRDKMRKQQEGGGGK
jgi:hypothetical protein